MCGIAGTYQQLDGAQAVRVMSGCLAHRGPDDEGLFSQTDDRVSVHLAHRRLSIIDLGGGHQPLVKQPFALCYNGELYNYRELRAQLRARGATFATSSDTEVVLEAWRQWGPACLSRFRGMFAFALFDDTTGSLFLARDQMGIKPLHYLLRDDGVAFASELKALVAAFGPELRMDPAALVASMLYFWVPDQRCSIGRVEKLQPGTWAEFRPDGSYQTHTYWERRRPRPKLPPGHRSISADARRVGHAHLVSDVPVSSFLSGGLDSSIVTVLAKRAQSRPRRLHDHVPAGGRQVRGDARRCAVRPEGRRAVRDPPARDPDRARHRGDLLPRMVGHPRRAYRRPCCHQHVAHVRAARQAGVKVILSGMGADELFGGYRKHLAMPDARPLPTASRGARGAARAVDRLPVAVGGRGLRYARWAKRFLTFSELPGGGRFPAQLHPVRLRRAGASDRSEAGWRRSTT